MNENIPAGILLFCYTTGLILWYLGRSREPANRSDWPRRLKTMIKRGMELAAGNPKLLHKWENLLQRKRRLRLDREIFNSSIMLKNLAIAEKGHGFSADYICERLMEHSKLLRPVYGEILSLSRSGKGEEAWNRMETRCGTRASRNFSLILSKLDRIDPAELTEQMEVFQETMIQERASREMKEIQRNSLLCTGLALASAFLLLLNFAAAVVFLTMADLWENAF